MPDRDKVISHFQDAIEASGVGNRWRFVRVDMLEDAIALLREQEARVLTLEEVRDKAEYMFLEKRSETWSDLFGCAIWGDWDGYGMDLFLGEDDYIRGMWENYGKTWRCWTAKPTDEQRRAVKWDEQNSDIHRHTNIP